MENNDQYKPVACSFYDSLEAYATLKKELLIQYFDAAGFAQKTFAKIRDLQTRDRAEYAILDNGLTIRLDRIIAIAEA